MHTHYILYWIMCKLLKYVILYLIKIKLTISLINENSSLYEMVNKGGMLPFNIMS